MKATTKFEVIDHQSAIDDESTNNDNEIDTSQNTDCEYAYLEPTTHWYYRGGSLVIPSMYQLTPTCINISMAIAIMLVNNYLMFCADNWARHVSNALILIALLTSFSITFGNPGYVRQYITKHDYERLKSIDAFECHICYTLRCSDVRLVHCWSCNCCVADIDHHCRVFGTCITQKNMCLFYMAIALLCMAMISVYVCMYLIMSKCAN